jgi:hypothetical protein
MAIRQNIGARMSLLRVATEQVPSVASHRGAAMSTRTILVALLAVLLLIAVGCGGGSGKNDNGRVSASVEKGGRA